MTDGQLERRLREYFQADIGDEGASLDLQASVLDIPETAPVPAVQQRFLAMNPFTKYAIYAITALVVLAGALALVAGGHGPAVGTSPSPSPTPISTSSPSPTAPPSPTPTPTASPDYVPIGTVTLTDTGCQWTGDTTGLPGPWIQIEGIDSTPHEGDFHLFRIYPGDTFAEFKAYIDNLEQLAQEGTDSHMNPPMAGLAGTIARELANQTSSLTAYLPSGATAGIVCHYANGGGPAGAGYYLVGPLTFK